MRARRTGGRHARSRRVRGAGAYRSASLLRRRLQSYSSHARVPCAPGLREEAVGRGTRAGRLRDGLRALRRFAPRVGGLSRTRRTVAGLGLALVVGGAALALLAPPPPVPVPEAPGAAPDAPVLRHLRDLPAEGAEPLVRPVGVAVGRDRVYVADSAAGVVRVFSSHGTDLGELGRGQLEAPAYVAVEETSGAVLVVDRQKKALLRFAHAGAEPTEVRPSSEPTAPWEPLGVDVAEDGRLAVTDSSARHRVLVMDAGGAVTLEIGGAPSVEASGSVKFALDFPNSVLMAGGRLWVADSNNRRMLVFGADGAFERLVRIDGVARGLAFLPGGRGTSPHVAITDVLGSEIVLVDLEGAEAARFGGPGAAPGKLAYPNDCAYDADAGLLYVADTGNARVQVWEVLGPGDAQERERAVQASPFSPMRLAGLIGAALGAVVAGGALWPGRRREGGTRGTGA